MNLIERLIRWARLPARVPEEPTCLVCKCTESRACPGGCGWEHLDLEGNYGLCTSCATEKICAAAERILVESIEGEPWKPKAGCPCPFCGPAKRKRGRS